MKFDLMSIRASASDRLREGERDRCATGIGLTQAIFLRSDFESRLQQIGPWALAAHPTEEIRVIVAATTKRADCGHHLGRAIGIMLLKPRPEQRCYFVRQANGQVEAARRASLYAGIDDMLELMIGDLRDDGRNGDVAGHARVIQRLDRGDALSRLGGTRFQSSGDLGIERSHRNRHRGNPQVCCLLEQIDVAKHTVGFGRDSEGMARFNEQLNDRIL